MIIFLLVALALRLIGFTSSPIWYDEAISLYRAQTPLVNFNLWEIILRIFAHGPLWLFRLPALICSITSLWLAWLIMNELRFNQQQRITACIFMAAFPGLIWIGQDARYYAAITALSMLTIYLALRGHWTFGVSFGLMASVHPTAPAYGIAAFAIAWLVGMEVKKIMTAALIGIGLMIAHHEIYTWIALQANMSGSQFWLAPLDLTTSIYSFIQAFFVNTLPPSFMIAAIIWLICVIIYAYLHPTDVTALITITPLTAIITVSLFYQNVFFYRTLMPLAMPLSLWFGSAWGHNRIAHGIGLLLVLIGLANYNPAARGYYIEHASTRIRDAWRDGDLIIYEDGLTALPFDYYLHDHNACVQSTDLLPAGYPLAVCDYAEEGRQWIITSTTQQAEGILFERLWPWQVTPIEVHLVDHIATNDDATR